MKKILSVLLTTILCLALASCGSSSLSGDPATYHNSTRSISIDLPTSSEDAWVIDEENGGDILSVTDKSGQINIQVQCMAKSKIEHIASDLDGYQDYAMVNTFNEILSSATLSDTTVDVPEFITDSAASTFALDDIKGAVVFMESQRCYYTYLIMATSETYDSNEKALLETITTLQELTEVQ